MIVVTFSKKEKLELVVIIIVVVGMVAGVIGQLTGVFDIRNLAWSGLQLNEQVLRDTGVQPVERSGERLASDISPDSQEAYFNSLVIKYPQADYLPVEARELGVGGALYNAYDSENDTTEVFVLMENLPKITGFKNTAWVEMSTGEIVKTVDGERVELTPSETYFVFSLPGKVANYQKLYLSYDPVERDVSNPETIFLSVNFE